MPSEYLKKIVLGWGIVENKIKVIYNAFSPLSPANKKINIEGDIILSIGRLAPWKGFLALIEIMPELLKINPNFKLAIAGEGDDREILERKIGELDLKDKVILTGKVEHDDLLAYYQAAKLLVLNTAYEGLSHILLEAQASGLPIVASQVGGNPEVITNNVNGLLVEYNNQEQIKEAILKISQDPELARSFSQAGLEKSKDFSFSRMMAETIKTLRETIKI
ncbi:MAG: glycosyltransferase family 4 protein [bacterium]